MTSALMLTLSAPLIFTISNIIKIMLKKRICEKGLVYSVISFAYILYYLFSPAFAETGMSPVMPVAFLLQICVAFELSLIFFNCKSDEDVNNVKISESYIISQMAIGIFLFVALLTKQWLLQLMYGFSITMLPLMVAFILELTRATRWLKKALYGGIMVALGVMMICLFLNILAEPSSVGLNSPGFFKGKDIH